LDVHVTVLSIGKEAIEGWPHQTWQHILLDNCFRLYQQLWAAPNALTDPDDLQPSFSIVLGGIEKFYYNTILSQRYFIGVIF
jgi:hypothetical protein